MAIEWEPITLYEHGELVTYKGERFRVQCTEHGANCPGGGLRSGFLPPPLCIEDGFKGYVREDELDAETRERQFKDANAARLTA